MHARIRRIRNRLRYRRFLQLHRFTRDESGLQLVEAAIVIPIFLVLFAATAEFGRFFYEYTTLAKAARAGSRPSAAGAGRGRRRSGARPRPGGARARPRGRSGGSAATPRRRAGSRGGARRSRRRPRRRSRARRPRLRCYRTSRRECLARLRRADTGRISWR